MPSNNLPGPPKNNNNNKQKNKKQNKKNWRSNFYVVMVNVFMNEIH